VGFGQKPRHRTVVSGAGWGLLSEIRAAKRRFALPEDAPVVCCYEAGRDGFWLHRFLIAEDVQNVVVDSSSIEVKRRQRRVKSDRLDADKLLTMLMRYHLGEKKVWSVVHTYPAPTMKTSDICSESCCTWNACAVQ
jgi:transposase